MIVPPINDTQVTGIVTDVASATTCDIGAAATRKVRITGAFPISSFGSAPAGTLVWIYFSGNPVLTNSAGLILPANGNNITAADGDSGLALSLGSSTWKVLFFQRATGESLILQSHGHPESAITFTDIATGNASTTAHGYSHKPTAPATGWNVPAIANGETVRTDKPIGATAVSLFSAANMPAMRTIIDIPSNSEDLARNWSLFGHVKFDGVTSGQRATALIPGLSIGRGDFSLSMVLKVPATNPVSGAVMWSISNNSVAHTGANCTYLWIYTGGQLILSKRSVADDVLNIFSQSGFITAYGGKSIRLTVVKAALGWVTYVDKLEYIPVDTDYATESTDGQYVHVAPSGFPEHVVSLDLFNYALTAAQVSELVDFGVVASNRWASTYSMNAVANQERNSLFTAAATDWGNYLTGVAALDTANDELDVTVTAAGDGATLALANLASLKIGSLYKLGVTVRNFTSVTGVNAIFGAQAIGTVAANGDYWLEFTPTAATGALTFTGTAIGSFSITNIRLERVLLANGSFEAVAADDFTSWTEAVTGTATVTSEETIKHSGTTAAKLYYETGGTAKVSQVALTVGRRYRATGWFYHDKGSALTTFDYVGGSSSGNTTITTDYTGAAISIPNSTWTQLTWDFIALQTSFGISVPTAVGTTKSLYCDDMGVTPLGVPVSLSPWGLRKDSIIWRNQALTGDATLYGSPFIVVGPGQKYTDDNLLLDNAGSADERWHGITLDGTAGATLAVGDLCYLNKLTDYRWELADADAEASAGGVFLGLCILAAIDGEATRMLVYGTMRSAAFPASIPIGAPVFISGTAGDITATAPTGTGKIVRIVAHAITAEPNTIFFNPSPDWMELSA